jgi:hypothetical protein
MKRLKDLKYKGKEFSEKKWKGKERSFEKLIVPWHFVNYSCHQAYI